MSTHRKKNARRILCIVLTDVLAFVIISAVIFWMTGFLNMFFARVGIDLVLPVPGEVSALGEVHVRETPVPTEEPTPAPTEAPTPEPTLVALVTPSPEPAAPAAEETPAPTEVPTPEPTATPEPTPTPIPGLLGDKFADKFLPEGAPAEIRADVYRSDKVAIEFSHTDGGFCPVCNRVSPTNGTCAFCGGAIKKANTQTVHYADVYIRDVNSLRSDFVQKTNETCRAQKLADRNNAILAINSDYWINPKIAQHGWFIRNSQELARFKTISADLCILYDNGEMEMIPKGDPVDYDAIMARYPTQIWYFGPSLLDKNGQPMTLTGSVAKANPRTVLGYYEPGHYCFLMVEGSRSGGKSRGLTLTELSAYCAEYGMTAAYNLDGGDSSVLYFNGVNYGHNGRNVSDIIYIAEP